MDRAMIPGAWRRRGFLFVAGACGWPMGISAVSGGAEGGAGESFWALNGRGSAVARHARFLAMMRRARSWVMDRAMIPGAWRRRWFFFVAGARGGLVWVSSVSGRAEGGAGDACMALIGRGSAVSRHARFLGMDVVGWAEESAVPSVRRGCHNCPRGSVREADPMLWVVWSIESSGSVLPMLPRR